MDIDKLILTEQVRLPQQLGDIKKIASASEDKKVQAAKEFEAVFINKLLEQIKNTSLDEDGDGEGTNNQVYGMFYMFLSRYAANSGGFGLWKQIYESLPDLSREDTSMKLLDGSV